MNGAILGMHKDEVLAVGDALFQKKCLGKMALLTFLWVGGGG